MIAVWQVVMGNATEWERETAHIYSLLSHPLEKNNIKMISSLLCFISRERFRSCCISQFLLSLLLRDELVHTCESSHFSPRDIKTKGSYAEKSCFVQFFSLCNATLHANFFLILSLVSQWNRKQRVLITRSYCRDMKARDESGWRDAVDCDEEFNNT